MFFFRYTCMNTHIVRQNIKNEVWYVHIVWAGYSTVSGTKEQRMYFVGLCVSGFHFILSNI